MHLQDFSIARQESNRNIFLFVDEDKGVETLTAHGTTITETTFEDRFEEFGVLGEGTTGIVKRCRERLTGKMFAVKEIHSRDDELLENWRSEFKHLVKLSHENIIRVNELIIDKKNGKVNLVMELFEGKELFELLAEVGHYDGWLNRKCCKVSIQTAALWRYVSPQTWCCA